MQLPNSLSGLLFRFVHSHSLVYNTCWEDPRLDRVALDLQRDDSVLVITSAGCNVLDYALAGPQRIDAVDMNPRQNALLELKLAGIRRLEFEDYFQLFGRGRLAGIEPLYRDALRSELSPSAAAYWDRHISCFSGGGWRNSFYFHGTSGAFARVINFYIDRVARVRDQIGALFAANSVDEQRSIYDGALRDAFWNRFIRWLMSLDGTLSLLGVPRSQRMQVEQNYRGGIAQFIEDCVEAVFTCLPLRDNYFWRVYLTGEYTPECCPEYLKPENFARLKAGLVDSIRIHTGSILEFLRGHNQPISKFVLLDHMDWLSAFSRSLLRDEWQAILDRAAPGARILWRSGGLICDYVDALEVNAAGKLRNVGDLLTYDRGLARELHARDRVHTYGSFYIADLAAA